MTAAIASSAPVAWTSGSATGSMNSEIGSQNGANWIQPPITDSVASTPTGMAIATPTRSRTGRWRCSRANADISPPKTMNTIRNV